MSTEIPIKQISGVKLVSKSLGVATAVVTDLNGMNDLPWDRYVRLQASAAAVLQTDCRTVLDVGGYDGALGLFLPNLSVDLVDPATTGGSMLNIPVDERAYDCAVAIDVLEHIPPKDRTQAIFELARVSKTHVVLNYPCQDSKDAQELVLSLTNNRLIREHVEWDLPDSDFVLNELSTLGFHGTIKPHTSIAVWLGQYITLNCAPEAAPALNRYLIANHVNEPFSKPLYHLIVAMRQ